MCFQQTKDIGFGQVCAHKTPSPDFTHTVMHQAILEPSVPYRHV